MSGNSGTEPAAAVDVSRFVTEKVAEEGGVISGSRGGSPASKHSSTGVGGGGSGGGGDGGGCGEIDAPQTTTNKGGVPDGNCSPAGVPGKGKKETKSDLRIFTFQDQEMCLS